MIVIAVSSALLIVCLSGCDFTSICVVVCVDGLTMDAPSVEFPCFWGVIRVYVVVWVPCRLERPYGISCGVSGSCDSFWIGISV